MNSMSRRCLRQYQRLTPDEKTDLIFFAVEQGDRDEVKRLAGLQAIESDRRSPCDKCECLKTVFSEILTEEQLRKLAGLHEE